MAFQKPIFLSNDEVIWHACDSYSTKELHWDKQYHNCYQCVTRFGKILPFWLIFNGLFGSIWQIFEHTLAKVIFYWAKFHCCKWPNIK